MQRWLVVAALIVFCFGQGMAYASAADEDLHSQSAAAVLTRDFSSRNLSYLLLNGKGIVIARRWPRTGEETPVGSLIKPFLATAYGRAHDSFPVFRCHGGSDCWQPRGHGVLGIQRAVALSCNSYFHQMLEQAEPGFAAATLQSFGLTMEDSAGRDKVERYEQGQGWNASPLVLAHAYLRLANDTGAKSTPLVLEGMAMAARSGTAAAVSRELQGRGALAKTGTAPCIHRQKAPGDGLAMVMVPADHPRLALLVRVHGKPGAEAAAIAGRMIAAIEKHAVRHD
ncbi:MAG TPA: penicillin-binding transpeptidase domain-containing protein [Candidatus Angelobacter sp.]|nr:penicillin-binding transpeptidase domain-containing protein [Candidatus Angelobacter sp.]